MPADILAGGNSAASSADFTLADGESTILGIRRVGTPSIDPGVRVEVKDNAGNYHAVGEVTYAGPPRRLDGPGTFRVSRAANVNCGVFRA